MGDGSKQKTKNLLREIRKQQCLSMMGVSVKSGVSTATLVGIEKWGYYPKAETRQKIAAALGVAEQEIWRESHDKHAD